MQMNETLNPLSPSSFSYKEIIKSTEMTFRKGGLIGFCRDVVLRPRVEKESENYSGGSRDVQCCHVEVTLVSKSQVTCK